MSDGEFFACSLVLFAAVILVMMYASTFFMKIDNLTYDTGRFYSMARVILNGATPYLDYQDPKPPLIFFILTLPLLFGQQFLGGLLLVAICNMVSAILVMMIAREFYGRFAGLAAGLLFLVNIAWAQGYFVMTEPFTIVFLLLATYFVLCGKSKHYFASGLSAGIAIGFKQYALIAVPLLLMVLLLEKDLRKMTTFLTGIMLPLLVIFGSIFFIYNAKAMDAALFWSFGVAGPYIGRVDVDNVLGSSSDLVEQLLCIIIALVLFAMLIFGFSKIRGKRKLVTGEMYCLLATVGFSCTLLIRQYLHYWALALPFAAILVAGWLLNDRN